MKLGWSMLHADCSWFHEHECWNERRDAVLGLGTRLGDLRVTTVGKDFQGSLGMDGGSLETKIVSKFEAPGAI